VRIDVDYVRARRQNRILGEGRDDCVALREARAGFVEHHQEVFCPDSDEHHSFVQRRPPLIPEQRDLIDLYGGLGNDYGIVPVLLGTGIRVEADQAENAGKTSAEH